MKLIPAIDIKNGKCVRLSEGKQESSTIYNNDPVAQAKFFEKEGCERIHIVDLDAAFGSHFNNKRTILNIRNAVSLEIELGGGIRSKKDIVFWLKEGINFLIIGSMAIKQKDHLKEIANVFKKKLYVSLDDLNGKVMINGWTSSTNFLTEEIVKNFNNSEIRGFVFTDIERDGMLTGLNIQKISNCLKYSKKPIIIGGGLSNNNDLLNIVNLQAPLLEGVIAGKSFYLGKINLKKAQKILN